MKFKRLATILMAAAMMVSLVACTGDNGENSETPVTSGNDVVEETETNHITSVSYTHLQVFNCLLMI